MNKLNYILFILSIFIFGTYSSQTHSYLISYSCSPTEEFGFAPANLEVITHDGQFKITEQSKSGKTQSFLLLGSALGSVNQFTFFGTEVALIGPLPKANQDIPSSSELDESQRDIAGVLCSACGINNWCAPSLGPAPIGWPGSSMPLETTIVYGNISYIITATEVKKLTKEDFRRNGMYYKTFAIDTGRTVVDADGFVELFKLSPPSDVVRY